MGNSNISTDLTLLSEWSNPGNDFLKNLEHSQAKPESQSASDLKICDTGVKFKVVQLYSFGVFGGFLHLTWSWRRFVSSSQSWSPSHLLCYHMILIGWPKIWGTLSTSTVGRKKSPKPTRLSNLEVNLTSVEKVLQGRGQSELKDQHQGTSFQF